MPDLTEASIHLWLAEHGSAAMNAANVGEENNAEVLPALTQLGTALEVARLKDREATGRHLAESETAHRLRAVVAHLGPARRLRLLHWISESGFEDPRRIVEQLTAEAPDGSGQAIRKWLLDIQRQDLLAALFAPERINMLLAACRDAAPPEPEQ